MLQLGSEMILRCVYVKILTDYFVLFLPELS